MLPQHERADGSMVVTGENNPHPVQLSGSDIQVPVDIQSRYAQTIQTQAGTMLPPTTGTATGVWVDCSCFDKMGITFLYESVTASAGDLQWSNDGVTAHGQEINAIVGGTANRKQGITDVKARYARLILFNTDAAPHTMSAWIYLKA